MRRLALLGISCALVLTAAPARASTAGRVIVVWADGTSLADWVRAPGLRALLDEASIALMSTRTAAERLDVRAMRASAAVTLGAGARAAGEPGTAEAQAIAGATAGNLGDALARANIDVIAFGDGDGGGQIDRAGRAVVLDADGRGPERRVPSRSDPAWPLGRVSSPELITARLGSIDARLIVIDPGDVARAQRAAGEDPEAAAALTAPAVDRLDRLVTELTRSRRTDDLIIVAGMTPSREWQRLGVRLAPVAMLGPGFGPGLLSSPTTRRAGVIALLDLTPTIADALGVVLPFGIDGRAVEVHPAADARARLIALDGDVTHAALARFPYTRRSLYIAIGVLAVALWLVLAGRGRARGGRWWPRGWRDAASASALVAAAMPLGIYLEGAFPTQGITSGALAVLAFAILAAWLARAVGGPSRALGWIAGATAFVIVADVALGAPLGHRSAYSFQIAIGGRFFGVDEGVLGLVVGAALVWAAIVLDTTRRPERARLGVALVLAAAVFVLGAPALGSKFGATYTAVPAFAIFALRARGVRIDLTRLVLVGVATVAVGASFIVADRLGAPETQSHVARAFEGETSVPALIGRKLAATWTISTSTIWTLATMAFAAAILVPALARRDAFARAMWGRPHLRAALWASAVGAAAGIVANDGGVIAAAPILLFAATASTITLTGGDHADRGTEGSAAEQHVRASGRAR